MKLSDQFSWSDNSLSLQHHQPQKDQFRQTAPERQLREEIPSMLVWTLRLCCPQRADLSAPDFHQACTAQHLWCYQIFVLSECGEHSCSILLLHLNFLLSTLCSAVSMIIPSGFTQRNVAILYISLVSSQYPHYLNSVSKTAINGWSLFE